MDHAEGFHNKFSLSESGDKDKALSSQVLEYYKKYSQNRELSKYFSGSSAPSSQFKVEDWYERIRKSPTIISKVQDSPTITEEFSENIVIKPLLSELASPMADESSKISDIINICVTSPTSSVTSNRKLEWDNGADIGYSNANKTLKKSVSLPVLNTLECKHLNLKELKKSENLDYETCIQCTNPTVIPYKPPYSTSSTSESTKSSKDIYNETSSTPEDNQLLSFSEISEIKKSQGHSSNNNNNNKRKDRGPAAESTPIEENLRKSPLDLNMVDRISFYKNMKILKLSIAKPIVVECRSVYKPQPGRDKFIQTSLPRNPSIAIQTDFDLTSGVTKCASSRCKERQSILYICHSDSDKETSSAMATQTNSAALSNCNSFEYLSGEDYDKNILKENVLQEIQPSVTDKIQVLPSSSSVKESEVMNIRTCPPKSDLISTDVQSSNDHSVNSTSSRKDSSSSADVPISNKCLRSDLDRKLQLLKKVIRSDKYDKTTKKYCLKKLIQTMVDSKLSDDSSESVSGSKKSKLNLYENKPWIPAQSKKLQSQTFVNEILPESGGVPPTVVQTASTSESKSATDNTMSKARLQRNQFTIVDDQNSIKENDSKYSHGDSNDPYDTIHTENATSLLSSVSSLNSNHKSRMQSWREDQTRSEQLLEERVPTEGNNEKSDLNKLKNLLEHGQIPSTDNSNNHLKIKSSNVLHNVLQKPHVEDMKGFKKSTTLYVVTTERSSSGSSTTKSGSILKKCRNPCCKGRYISPNRCKSIHFKDDTSQNKCTCCNKKVPECNAHSSASSPCAACCKVNDAKFDLQNAHLVSSQQFICGNDKNSRTSIRRYTFEIPLDTCEIQPPPTSAPPAAEAACGCGCIPTCTEAPRVEAVDCSCQTCDCAKDNKVTQTLPKSSPTYAKMSTNGDSSSSSESDSTPQFSSTPQFPSTRLCSCCKKNSGSNYNQANTKYVLCHPCYYYNQGNNSYMQPGHICTCHNNRKQETIAHIRKTIRELENIETEEQYCKCKMPHSSSDYCSNCGCKIYDSLKKRKGGIAYLLTLDSNDARKKKKHKMKTQPELKEIKIKVSGSKSSKEKGEQTSSTSECDQSCKENDCANCHKKRKNKQKPTLQDYLHSNMPNFIASAEERRKCLLDLAYMREKRCQKYKQLLALTNGVPFKKNNENNSPKYHHIFTIKEMKQMTAKHYKKLPEYQQKLEDTKERQVRKGNRLLADIFNQQLRRQVLKGKHTIPPDQSVIRLV